MLSLFENLPEKYSLLLIGPKSVNKTGLGVDLMKYYIQKGDNVVFMTTDYEPEKIKKIFATREIYLHTIPHRFIMIDCYTPWTSAGWSEGSEYAMSTQPDVHSLKLSIMKATKMLGGKVHLIIDSTSSVFQHNGTVETLGFINNICGSAGKDFESALFIIHDNIHDEKTIDDLHHITNGLIETKFDIDQKTFIRYISNAPMEKQTPWIEINQTESGYTN